MAKTHPRSHSPHLHVAPSHTASVNRGHCIRSWSASRISILTHIPILTHVPAWGSTCNVHRGSCNNTNRRVHSKVVLQYYTKAAPRWSHERRTFLESTNGSRLEDMTLDLCYRTAKSYQRHGQLHCCSFPGDPGPTPRHEWYAHANVTSLAKTCHLLNSCRHWSPREASGSPRTQHGSSADPAQKRVPNASNRIDGQRDRDSAMCSGRAGTCLRSASTILVRRRNRSGVVVNVYTCP